MLLRIVRILFNKKNKTANGHDIHESALDKANHFAQKGDLRSAIEQLRLHLKVEPHDVIAINNLGCHLADIGNEAEAINYFELAYSLDDAFLPGVVNHAKLLNDRQRSEESLKFLRHAKAVNPDFPHTDAVYGSLALARGDAKAARKHALNAWLASFDNLRFANCYLLYSAYADIDEQTLAAEHNFWAQTIRPLDPEPLTTPSIEKIQPAAIDALDKSTGILRVGYWSPDFKNHSVRFFFRPLLDNHDRSKFEVFLYHDHPGYDEQTEEIRRGASQFFDVSTCTDQQLVALIKSHNLDILVELAGHTSNNRLHLLQQQLAKATISGIGYPPTTGLKSIDAKLVDPHIVSSMKDHGLYSEMPLVVPESFWCFDPHEQTSITSDPPVVKNNYVTFACVGNIAKISDRIINCWAQILDQVANSKLLLRSISFNDEAALQTCQRRLLAAGIASERLLLMKPEGGSSFLASYNAIDIVLDTFPFNGGTTTCFATYMGVPVISMAGQSLISRMGKSVLSNLGLKDWVVTTDEEYIQRATEASKDIDGLKKFRATARDLFRNSSLGNGKKFATELEQAYIDLLSGKQGPLRTPQRNNLPDLPAAELARRAYVALRLGHEEAATRIVCYCLRAYPNFGPAHILHTQHLAKEKDFRSIAQYLTERLENFDGESRSAAIINICRNHLLADDFVVAKRYLEGCHHQVDDPLDLIQIQLLKAVIAASSDGESPIQNWSPPQKSDAALLKITIFVVSSDDEFNSIVARISAICITPTNSRVSFKWCNHENKRHSLHSAIRDQDTDIAIWISNNIYICTEDFFQRIIQGLQCCDLLGFAGSTIYDRIDWRLCQVEHRVGSYLTPSGEKNNAFDLVVCGTGLNTLTPNMAILDGSLFAFSLESLRKKPELAPDEFLESADVMMEEDIIHQCYRHGLRLAAAPALGILKDWRIQLPNKHLGEARSHLAQKLNFDVFGDLVEDRTVFSAPVASTQKGLMAQGSMFRTGFQQ